MRDVMPIEPTARVAALILERATCIDCIARRCAMLAGKVEEALAMIRRGLELHSETALCRTCGKTKPVVSARRP